ERARRARKEEGRPVRRPNGPPPKRRRLGDRPDVRRLRALLALRDVELDLLVLLQVPVAGPGDRAEVHEDVRATVVLGDEAETLLGIEPLHGACAHEQIPPFLPVSSLTAARRAPARRPEVRERSSCTVGSDAEPSGMAKPP